MSISRAICRRSRARDERAASRRCGEPRLRRRGAASRQRGRDRRARRSPRSVPRGDVPAGMPVRTLPDGAWLAPGFIDMQVNGGGDVLFNDAPTRGGDRGDRGRAPEVRHHRAAADADQRHAGRSAPGASPRSRAARPRHAERARHPSRGAVSVAGKAGRARSARSCAAPDADDLEDDRRAAATASRW